MIEFLCVYVYVHNLYYQVIKQKLHSSNGPLAPNKHLHKMTDETFTFLKSRHQFWKSQTTRKAPKSSGSRKITPKDNIQVFNLDSIFLMEEDNPLKEKVEVINEEYKLKKCYNFQDMYDAAG